MNQTPDAERIQIILCGIRNSGKSSLINNIFEREVAIVSPQAGTTTDPVSKQMELRGVGPVGFIDTAGLDDSGGLGEMRVRKTLDAVRKADLIVFVTPRNEPVLPAEIEWSGKIDALGKPIIYAGTFADRTANAEKLEWLERRGHVAIDNTNNAGIEELRKEIVRKARLVENELSPLEGIVKEDDLVLLVVPVDLAAPKGRLILPQVETIRDALDRDCTVVVVKERELSSAYASLNRKPSIVITDSQAFNRVSADIPPDQTLTSFSILFARKKGDFNLLVRGARAIPDTPRDAVICIVESCSHHKQADDIGTVKIPRLYRQLLGADIRFEFKREMTHRDDMAKYYCVVFCGGCMAKRNEIVDKMRYVLSQGVFVTNYGLFFAWAHGLLPRALEPFPEAYAEYTHA